MRRQKQIELASRSKGGAFKCWALGVPSVRAWESVKLWDLRGGQYNLKASARELFFWAVFAIRWRIVLNDFGQVGMPILIYLHVIYTRVPASLAPTNL